jgi:seryl-tRNA synthetase
MLDIQFIRDNPDLVAEKSRQKGYEVDIKQLLELDSERRTRLTQIDELRARRNAQANESKDQKPTEEQIAAGRQLKEEVAQLETDLSLIDQKYYVLLKGVPNMPLDDVPVGQTEQENQVVKEVGEKPQFDFEPKNHWELAEAKNLIDKSRAAKVTGSRFAYIKGDLARLQFAIIQFVLDQLADEKLIKKLITENDLNLAPTAFTPILPPVMIRENVYDQMDRLEPREDRYHLEGEDDNLWLIGSAEHIAFF